MTETDSQNIQYGQLPDVSFEGESSLHYAEDIPTHIEFNGKTYEVLTGDTIHTSEEFFEVKNHEFVNPLAQKLADSLEYSYEYRISNIAEAAHKDDLRLIVPPEEIAGANIQEEYTGESIPIRTNVAENALLARDFVIKHFKDWIKRGVPITLHSFTIPKLGINFRRLIVGETDQKKITGFLENRRRSS